MPSRFVLALACLLPILNVSSEAQDAPPPEPFLPPVPAPDHGPDLREAARKITQLSNVLRGENDRDALTISPELEKAALALARYMAETGKFAHDADDRTPTQRAEAEGYDDPCLVAENIARVARPNPFTAAELAAHFVDGWMHSPNHRKNLLDPDATDIGAAIARDPESGRFFAVQLLGRPRSAMIEFSIINKTDVNIHYTLGDQMFTIAPNVTRGHGQCRPQTLAFAWPDDAGEPVSVQPRPGQRLVIERVRDAFRITAEPPDPQTPPD